MLANQAALAIENCLFMAKYKESQERLFTAEKMAMIGGMADGLAHQIKNRIQQFSVVAVELGLETKEVLAAYDTKAAFDTAEMREKLEYLIDCSESINSNVDKTNKVIRGILNFARSERKEMFFGDFNLRDALAQALDLLVVKHQLATFPLTVKIPDNDVIYGIKPQFVECLFNTLDNAYEAIREKADYHLEPAEQAEFTPQITLTLRETPATWLIEIEDNGMGVKEEDKCKVFVAFFTTKPSSKSGSGIGSYTVKRMIEENHHGRIRFTSTFKKGSVFTIEIPKRPETPESSEAPASAQAQGDAQ
jgi:signal transduction histidine kinase